jgi:hypothetical protein
VPKRKAIRAIVDNYATHKHPKARRWLARHPRWTFHFTSTSASWLDAVEGFFAKLTKFKRGLPNELEAAIDRFLCETNANPKAFVWTSLSGLGRGPSGKRGIELFPISVLAWRRAPSATEERPPSRRRVLMRLSLRAGRRMRWPLSRRLWRYLVWAIVRTRQHFVVCHNNLAPKSTALGWLYGLLPDYQLMLDRKVPTRSSVSYYVDEAVRLGRLALTFAEKYDLPVGFEKLLAGRMW